MCYILTYVSWVIDLIQRLWTFLMSCCIAIAVCCVFVIACMAGIAFGYNYSLYEFLSYNGSQLSVTYLRNIPSDKPIDTLWDGIEYQKNNNNTVNKVFKKISRNNEPKIITMNVDSGFKKDQMALSSLYEDGVLEKILNKYPTGSVNQMKAVLNQIYSDKLKEIFKSTEYTTTETNTGEHVTLFSEYDDSELMHWRRMAQNLRYANRIESREAVPPGLRKKNYNYYYKYTKHNTTAIPKVLNTSTFNVGTAERTRTASNTSRSLNITVNPKLSHHTKTLKTTQNIYKSEKVVK